eukprot:TRINITY_DN45362_c0_g1_i1.p1 TRINITY_DN45362_c0_g1~~TRINITY_DN45362_c0_g1_i1.p1  ORF type:complete len:864 (-),score=105.23 TRINITY_DN45362_c0_g1_i1:98-2689(-)
MSASACIAEGETDVDVAVSPLRVIYIGGLKSNSQGSKPAYLMRHFKHVSIPAVKHSSYSATKTVIAEAVREFLPDVVVAHAAGVNKATTLAISGVWAGPLVLLAGGNGCAAIADMVGRAVTVVIPRSDPEVAAQRRAIRAAIDPNMVVAVEVDDSQDLNTSMVTRGLLYNLIVTTVRRHHGQSSAATSPLPAAAIASSDNGDGNQETASKQDGKLMLGAATSKVATVFDDSEVWPHGCSEDTERIDKIRWLFSESTDAEDGVISREAFKDLLCSLGYGLQEVSTDAQDRILEEVLRAADSNGDGNIDIDEFVRWAMGSDNEQRSAIFRAETSRPIPASRAVAEVAVVPAAATAATGEVKEESPAHGVAAMPEPSVSSSGIALTEAVSIGSTARVGSEENGLPRASTLPPNGGQLFTWGRGTDGQLGQDKVSYPVKNCAMPCRVPGMRNIVHVACGGGQQGCTAAVTAAGELFTFGNNYKGRLGHGEGPSVREPRLVAALASEHVLMVACSADHSAALVRGGRVFLWGANQCGQLGRGHADKGPATATPGEIPLESPAMNVDCEDQYSAVVLQDGRLFTWGCNHAGKLGLGDGRIGSNVPAEVCFDGRRVASVSLGSLYAGAVGIGGELFMWGYGGHGNLGLGNRSSKNRPTAVSLGEAAAQVACTRGQEGCKGGLNPKSGGNEGPHTVVVSMSGALYTMGTCHKGLLCNLGSKTGAFGKPWDELRPYRVGGPLRNDAENPPLSPLAVWPPPYDVGIGPVVSAVSAHIHAACVGADGRAWAWGCGSNDGRCGVERFLNMKGDGCPPEVDVMKCYMMGPHRIGVARPMYWKNPSLQGLRVYLLATGRNHMACVAGPLEEGGEADQ